MQHFKIQARSNLEASIESAVEMIVDVAVKGEIADGSRVISGDVVDGSLQRFDGQQFRRRARPANWQIVNARFKTAQFVPRL